MRIANNTEGSDKDGSMVLHGRWWLLTANNDHPWRFDIIMLGSRWANPGAC